MKQQKANDIHLQFASCFNDPVLEPYAYWLSKKMAEGHICIPLALPAEVKERPWSQLPDANLLSGLTEWVTTEATAIKPFVLQNSKLYLHRYFQYETWVLQSIRRLMKAGVGLQQQRMQELTDRRVQVSALGSAISAVPVEPADWHTDWQLVAAISAYCQHFTIITGGPGTGKTTTVAKILSILYENQPSLRVALAAPTGKAAMRMGESLKATLLPLSATTQSKFAELEPATIHRLLGYQFDSLYFKHNEHHPLPYDVVIIDEASMIDVALFAKLLSAISNNTRLILLGDRNQLASVEAGSLFGDLCRLQDPDCRFTTEWANFINSFLSSPNNQIGNHSISNQSIPLMHHVIELKKSHRFGSNSGIGHFSRAIIQNEVPVLQAAIEQSPWNDVQIDTDSSFHSVEKMMTLYKDYISEPDIVKALSLFNRFRILCAVRESNRGVYAMNKMAEKLLQQSKVKNADGTYFSADSEFYENRPVIITQNIKDLDLFNGDIGIVRKNSRQQFRVYFEGKDGQPRELPVAFIGKCETVFAMTIHKSQGSEYDHVLVMLPESKENQILTRELLYTAITRAKKQVMISAAKEVILQTASTSVSRVSGINDRVNEMTD